MFVINVLKMFEIITIFSALNQFDFNNSLHFNVCGIENDASYIYLDSRNLLFGVVENSNITHFNYTLIDKCNQSWIPDDLFTTDDNMVVTRMPQSTVTTLQTNNSVILNLTDADIITSNKCSLHHYYSMHVAVATFVIGLVVKPEKISEFLKRYFREQLYAGNYFSRIRTKL